MKRKGTLIYVKKKSLQYIFLLKEHGGMILGGESIGGTKYSKDWLQCQCGHHWPHLNFHFSLKTPSTPSLTGAIH